ncbi:MAG: peptidoglycan-binding protein [Candidatus Kaiserbacteria bacterium]|nr:peptidoglycan-binding protein [Candidatus Kaiserbacteria bacterium]
MRYIRYSLVLSALIGGLLAIGILSVSFAQQGEGDFRIVQMLRNNINPSVVAFQVYGTFESEDVVNMYSNDVFIKAKAINTPDAIGTKEITIENISIDVFQTGDNLIVAKIERAGAVVQRTPAFRLTVQEPPPIPTVRALVNQEEELIGLDITAAFKENDVIRVFLNDAEIRTKTILLADIGKETVRIAGIPIETLRIGQNFFTASVSRGEAVSERSERSEPILIEDPTEEEEKEEEGAALLQCATYGEPQKILAREIDAYEGFGNDVAMRDGVLAVGTRGETSHIYIKEKEGAALRSSAILREQHIKKLGSTRKSVAVQDKMTVLVGDPGSDHVAMSGGAVQVYKRAADQWTVRSIVAPKDLKPYEAFGRTLAVEGNILAVGASRLDNSGAVYIYTNTNGVWGNPFRVIPDDTAPDQEFGHSITVSNGRVAVGAPGDRFSRSGAVYVYTKTGNAWSVEKIVPQKRRLNAHFGNEVVLYDGVLFVGAMRDDQSGDTLNSGAVYLYIKEGGAWQLAQKLTPQANDTGAEFGTAIGRSGNMLAIGAPRSNFGRKKSGAVYLYKQARKGALWSFERAIAPTGLQNGDRFGASIAFDGLHIFAGAYGDDEQEKNTGAVYSYAGETVACTSSATASATEEEEKIVPLSQAEREEKVTSLLDTLKKQKEVLSTLASSASSIASRLGEQIQGAYDEIAKKKEGIVIYDEDKVLANAQRRAAEQRGIIGPGLPNAVAVQRVESTDKIPSPPTEETVRTRDSVVRETEQNLGTVVPVSYKDLRLGDVHEDVYRLQVFLNSNGYRVAEEGEGSPGNETSVFNEATDRTLRWFQLVEGLPVTGVLDKETREKMLGRITTFKQ